MSEYYFPVEKKKILDIKEVKSLGGKTKQIKVKERLGLPLGGNIIELIVLYFHLRYCKL